MGNATVGWRTIVFGYGLVGFLCALPLTGILVFFILQLKDKAIENALVTVAMSAGVAILTALSALTFWQLSRHRTTGFLHGCLAALTAYLLFFICLGIAGNDVLGMTATGLHALGLAPILLAFPALAGLVGVALRRRSAPAAIDP